MGAKMRTRPMAKWVAKGNESPGSRKSRREYTKSIARKGYQTQTKGAANRARKSVTGKARIEPMRNVRRYVTDEPLADWERAALRNAAVISMMP